MYEFDDAQIGRRGFAARLGICILNVIQPGLGLIRLARYKAGFIFLLLTLAELACLIAVYKIDPQLTYGIFLALIAAAIIFLMIAWGGSIFLTWRWSGNVSPRHGWLWRWYGLLGLSASLSLVSWPFSDVAKLN